MTSLALGPAYDFPSAREMITETMDKIDQYEPCPWDEYCSPRTAGD